MTEDNPKFSVAPSPAVPLIMNFLRQLGILIGGMGTIIALVGRRDVRELSEYMMSDAMLPIVAAAIFVASSIGSLWKTLHNEKIKRLAEPYVPNWLLTRRGADDNGGAKLLGFLAIGLVAASVYSTAAHAAPKVTAPANSGKSVPSSAIGFGLIAADYKPVDVNNPLPVASGEGGSVSVTITSGTSLSGGIDLASQRVHRIVMPSSWTTAALTFQSSHSTCSTYSDLYDVNGEITVPLTVAGASRSIVLDPASFYGVKCLKIRSGSSAAPVNQAADRVIAIITVPR